MQQNARQILPGLEEYPLLEQRMNSKLRQAADKNTCRTCDVARIVAQFREELEHRRRRDKQAGQW